MGRKMRRGKQQILFSYLPGKTFDFERVATIARVQSIRGIQRTDLNAAILLQKIAEEAQAWDEPYRPILRDGMLRDPSRFILLEPKGVQAEMFPRILWCQNRACSRVLDYTLREVSPPTTCPVCEGQLVQLRFIKIHRCGALQPLVAPRCQRCRTSAQMALDTRGSERISNFRWVCRRCNTTTSLFGGRCRECDWPGANGQLKNMDIEVHRAGRTFYAHTAVLLNIPERRLDSFFNLPEWPAVVAAKFLDLQEVSGRPLTDFGPTVFGPTTRVEAGLSGEELDGLFRRQEAGELTPEQLVAEMQVLRQQRRDQQLESSPNRIVQILEQRTGVSLAAWEKAGQEMLEAVMPLESGYPEELFDQAPSSLGVQVARRLGLSRLTLVADFPIVTATYGYSRAEYAPNECRLNPFPPERDHGGRFPIYVDLVQADAILLRLDPERVCVWLERNGFPPSLPIGNDADLSQRAYFVHLFEDVPLRVTLRSQQPQARLVFGLIHTFSHFCVRHAALLCGLDRTSLSEYILPRTLTFALYCSHRFGATIGALTSLFEQSLADWLTQIVNNRRCVYDPVCADRTGNCHACTHLAETSCRFFNLNLGRAFLFGGRDPELGDIKGYFDPSF